MIPRGSLVCDWGYCVQRILSSSLLEIRMQKATFLGVVYAERTFIYKFFKFIV